MAELVQGLRPERNNTSVKRKEGRTTVERARSTSVGLTPSAGRVQSYAGNVAVSQDNKGLALAKALGAMSSSLEQYANVKQKNTDNEILASAEYHIQRIKDEVGSGVVSRVQIGEMLPEASATVTATLAQAMGKQYAKEAWQPALEAIESDDNLRLNTAARSEYLNKFREQLQSASDDPFYVNGLVTGMEAEIAQNEDRWLRATAEYHKDVIREDFQNQIAEVFMSGGDLEKWDTEAQARGPFGKQDLKKMVVDTVTNIAVERRDENLLNQIPSKFLNAESKRNLTITQQQIRNAKWSEQTQQWQLEDRRQKEDLRNGQIAIIGKFVDTGVVNPADYRHDPDLYAFALTMSQREGVNPVVSAANASLFRDGVLQSALADDPSVGLAKLGYYGDLSLDGIQSWLVQNPQLMNAKDTVAIMQDLPKLLEGQNLMRDPMVSDNFEALIKPALAAIRSTANQELNSLLNGNNFETTVTNFYYKTMAAELDSYRQENNNEWPKRRALQDIVDKVVEKTTKVTERLSAVNNIGKSAPQVIEEVTNEELTYDPNTGTFK